MISSCMMHTAKRADFREPRRWVTGAGDGDQLTRRDLPMTVVSGEKPLWISPGAGLSKDSASAQGRALGAPSTSLAVGSWHDEAGSRVER